MTSVDSVARFTRLHALKVARNPTREGIVDVLLVVAAIAAMHVEFLFNDKSSPGVMSSLVIVATSLTILLRRHAPVWGFVLAMIMLFAVLETACVFNTMPMVPVIIGYTLAQQRGLRAAVLVGVPAVAATLAMLWIYEGGSLFGWGQVKNVSLVIVPLALGVASHDRRIYTAALVERAETAERNREEEALRRVGEERLRIARDVHDVVAHAMVTINVQAGVGAHLLEGGADTDKAHSTLREIKKVSGDALGELRSMLGILREDETDAAPTRPVQRLADLGDLRESLAVAGVELTLDVAPAAQALPASIESAGYRIIQEALTNVIRHAGPTRATVRIVCGETQVLLEVDDEGGAAPSSLHANGSGNGLRGMRERAEALGGTLVAGPRPAGGWRVVATLPLAPEGSS